MDNDIASAVAAVAESLEKGAIDYVVYRDHAAGNRLVILVETKDEAAALRSSLRRHGAYAPAQDQTLDFVLPGDAKLGRQAVGIIVKAGSGKSGVPNLLWQAATFESALAARQSVQER